MMLEDWATSRTLSVGVNGAMVDAGGLWAMMDGALEAVEWLRARRPQSFGITLKPGDLVLAGPPLGLHPVKPGDDVIVSVDDRKYVECRIS